jgi:hypothetical protein
MCQRFFAAVRRRLRPFEALMAQGGHKKQGDGAEFDKVSERTLKLLKGGRR